MAKLVALVLAFTALVAFATAHTTIVTTTIEDENPQRQCSQRLQGQRLNQCRMYLQQGQSPYEVDIGRQRGQQQQQVIQQCCEELQNVDEQCQCEAVKQVFRDVQQQQQGQQIGPFGGQQTRQLRQKAQMLPNVCNLQSRQCQIGSNMDIPFWPFGRDSGSQQCSQRDIQRSVNQCQRYVQQQMQSPRTLVMSINRRGQEQQGMERQCCDQLQNLNRECQCEAIKEVAQKVMRQQQQQAGRRYGGQQEEMEIVRRVVQNLPNQCDLQVQQCNIPYGMF